MEKIVETKVCKHCLSKFKITDKDLEFYKKVSPSFWWKKYLIPSPTLCPDCRNQRRLSFRNVNNLYKTNNLVSPYSPDKKYNVVEQKKWFWGDIDWIKFWIEFDPHKNVLEQFQYLQKKAPRWANITINCENCDRSLNISDSKNCYFVKSSFWCENCFYSSELRNSCSNVFDTYLANDCDNIYESIDIKNSSNVFYWNRIQNWRNSIYVYDCVNIKNCIWCVWLRNKEYYFLNEQITKNEFETIFAKMLQDNEYKAKIYENFKLLQLKTPNIALKIIWSENCIWDEIINSNNVYYWFSIIECEDCKYIYIWSNTNTCQDCTQPDFQNLTYEVSSSYKVYNSCFCFNVGELEQWYYCETCYNCKNCFWCVWLLNKSYCILNKQYSKEDYEKLVPKIIENMSSPQPSPEWEGEIEWWEFFPSSLSPFWYNETVANEYYPLESSELSVISQEIDTFKVCKLKTLNWKLKINWSDYKAPFPKVEKIISASKLPENISEIPDDILNWAIEDEERKTMGLNPLFRIIRQELEFYRKYNLPIPKRHPDQRHLDRMKLRNPRKLFERTCDKCGKGIQTTYAPERPEIVYCQECYEKEIY